MNLSIGTLARFHLILGNETDVGKNSAQTQLSPHLFLWGLSEDGRLDEVTVHNLGPVYTQLRSELFSRDIQVNKFSFQINESLFLFMCMAGPPNEWMSATANMF